MKKSIVLLLFVLSVNAFAQVKKTDVFYEIFVRSFSDSDQDGVGDIKGITMKLDYIKDLGITGLWLTPVHPSPTYHKYDVLDYKAIDREYGSIDDYKELVAEAHKRGIKILLDLVVNHTGSEHPWFKAACGNDKKYRDYYVWSDTAKTHGWYGNPKNPQQKYYAFFWQGMPDLNFDNPEVRKDIIDAGLFWIKDIGIDGFRLDAAQHVYEPDDVIKNNVWWSEFRTAMRKQNPNTFLVGEVWNKDSIVATYLKSSLDASFNFDLSGAIIKAVKDSNAEGFVEKLSSIHSLYRSYNPDFTDAIFISNHDQDRYASTLNNDADKIKQAFTILMTLPGIPFLYYGEELGMLGKSPDEYRREPFLWGDNRMENTKWEKPVFSTSQNVKPLNVQVTDGSSLYPFYKSIISFRNDHPVLSRGILAKANMNVPRQCIAYQLSEGSVNYLVIHNVGNSRFVFPLSVGGKAIFNKLAVRGNNIVLKAHETVIVQLK